MLADLGEEFVQLLGPVLKPLGLELCLFFSHLAGEGGGPVLERPGQLSTQLWGER